MLFEGSAPKADDTFAPATVSVAGVGIHPVTRATATQLVVAWAARKDPALVVTPNVDHVVTLSRDADFSRAYDAAHLRLCDGMPLLALSRLCGRGLPERVTGADLFLDVCAAAAEDGLSVFIAGGMPEVLQRGLESLATRFPGLIVTGHSPPVGFEGTDDDITLQRVIAEREPDIVMVCLGAPRAEIWAAQQVQRYGAVYLCVGAAIDFAAGARKRAPRWVQRAGVEWVYRLGQEPRRLWRRYLVHDRAFAGIALREILRCAPLVGRRHRSR